MNRETLSAAGDRADVACYLQSLATSARTLPLAHAVRVLRGALLLAGDAPAAAALRDAFRDLSSAEDQLESLAGPAPQHPLAEDAP